MQIYQNHSQTIEPYIPFSLTTLFRLGTKFLIANLHSPSRIYSI